MIKNSLMTGLILLLAACVLLAPGPAAVTEKFWSAVQEIDLEKARELVTPDSIKELSAIA